MLKGHSDRESESFADRQLRIDRLGVRSEAPSFQESLEPHWTEGTSSVQPKLEHASLNLEASTIDGEVANWRASGFFLLFPIGQGPQNNNNFFRFSRSK